MDTMRLKRRALPYLKESLAGISIPREQDEIGGWQRLVWVSATESVKYCRSRRGVSMPLPLPPPPPCLVGRVRRTRSDQCLVRCLAQFLRELKNREAMREGGRRVFGATLRVAWRAISTVASRRFVSLPLAARIRCRSEDNSEAKQGNGRWCCLWEGTTIGRKSLS